MNIQSRDSVTIRDAITREVIAEVGVGSQAMMWPTRTTTLRELLNTSLQSWIGHQQQLIAAPDWHPDEPRLAATQAELLDRRVTVADEYVY